MKIKTGNIELEIEGGEVKVENGNLIIQQTAPKVYKTTTVEIPQKRVKSRHWWGSKANKHWKKSEDNTLIQLTRKGLSDAEVAKALRRTTFAITNRRSTLKRQQPQEVVGTSISKPRQRIKWRTDEMVNLAHGLENGKTLSQIAKELGRSKSSVTARAYHFRPEKIKN